MSTQRRLSNILKQLNNIPSENITQIFCSGDDTTSILTRERQKANFDVRQLTHLLDGGEMHTQIYELIFAQIENDDVFNDDDTIFYMNQEERRVNTMKKIIRTFSFRMDSGNSDAGRIKKKSKDPMATIPIKFWEINAIYDPSWATKIGVHFGLFQNAIESGGTPEQIAYYVPLVQNLKIYGCFAMTELGHGSFVRGIETTATYDVSTQEFIINSPTPTSTKWWIGGAGQTATHSIVFAKLILDGVDYGVHSFIVQLRRLEDGHPCENISVGDCGPKMGRNGIDNGFIQFHNKRIPRENMLMRWSQVSPEGEYSAPPKSQLSYGALLGGRIQMIRDAAKHIERALTIAVRYSAIRKQFPSFDNPEDEESILNYQTHQFRLMPMLATAFAFHFASTRISDSFEDMLDDIDQGSLESLQVVHATSAGLKAISTWWCNESLEVARQCMGGNGYSTFSGIPSSMADWAVNCTWEGDNTVLCQQTARFLVSAYERHMNGGKVGGFISYLQEDILDNRSDAKIIDDVMDIQFIYSTFKWLCKYMVHETFGNLTESKKYTDNEDIATNDNLVDLVLAAKNHCYFYVLHNFLEVVDTIEEAELRKTLETILRLFGLYKLEENMRYLLEGGLISKNQSKLISKAVRILINEVRQVAVPLVDSFNLPDFLLRSPLGRYDGNIYPAYIEKVKSIPENQSQISSYYHSVLQPALNGNLTVSPL